jgi:hypothetical protein
MEKNVKYHGLVHSYMHDFQVKINQRHKSGDAVACASVAPVRLHCLIHHKGTNTWRIVARRGGMGGGGLITLLATGAALPRHLVWGFVLKAREDIQKIIFEGDNKTTNPVVAKSYKKSKLSSSFFPLPPRTKWTILLCETISD